MLFSIRDTYETMVIQTFVCRIGFLRVWRPFALVVQGCIRRSGGCGLEYASGSQILRFVISSDDLEISTNSTHKRLDGTVEVVAPLCDAAQQR
jgi:hypothetical protein